MVTLWRRVELRVFLFTLGVLLRAVGSDGDAANGAKVAR